MKRHLTVLVASLALLLAAGAGTAYAGGDGLAGQAIDQSQNATNSIAQNATAQSAAVNASPNVAIANEGSVDQSSGASSGAVAGNENESQQDNTLSNTAGQSQSGALADDNGSHCCGTSEQSPKSQSTQQSQDATNSISQNAEAKSVAVNASPNVAVLNKGGDCKCGGGVEQSSNASSGALAVNKNDSTQSNSLENDARQSQGGKNGGEQSIDQSQNASNSIDQNAKATSVAVNASPNVAIANSGPVKQDSNASSGAYAVNENHSQQSNTLRNDAGQSQAGPKHGCCKGGHGSGSQDISQSQNASNPISQNAESRSFALNASPNVALLNGGKGKCGGCGEGGVRQSSGASSGALAVNQNHATQSNTLGQSADQKQRGHGCRDECKPCGECKPRHDCERRCED